MRLPAPGCVLSLRGLCISYDDRQVLSQVDLDLPEKGVTVLLGPSGTGKSALLRTVAGENAGHPSIRVEGRVDYVLPDRNPPLVMQKAKLLLSAVLENLVHDWPERANLTAAQQHAHVTQWLASLGLERLVQHLHVPVISLPLSDQRLVSVLRRAMVTSPLLLLDEPTAGLSDEQAEPILALMRRLRQQSSLLVAMHNLGQSRAIADAVVLLASRCVQEHSGAQAFFTAPASESGRLFLRTGSCPEEPRHQLEKELAPELASTAPKPSPPPHHPLPPRSPGPNGFAWLIPGRLAGTPWPGLLRPAAYDLELLQAAGVTQLFSVTNRPFPAELAQAHGMAVENDPMVDMQPPDIPQAIALCQRIEASLASGEVMAVHCHAGLGRTGTTLCAYWIWLQRGRTTGELALQQIRRFHLGWVQSAAQVDFLHVFALAVARMNSAMPSLSTTAGRSDVTLSRSVTTTPR
ncbi:MULTISPECIES: ATP-binding cassette domain-containing protein [unclassified Variovorax]|uniref:ATP-binding cassette domain-containing protein n=1 Tax=unclassified Variovorax TaxID=663243 RepID=UPI003F45D279